MKRVLLVTTLIAGMSGSPASDAQTFNKLDKPYLELREAYSDHDAARAYATDAIYNELYDETSPRLLAGREAITRSFMEMFSQLSRDGKASQLDLNFRLVTRQATPDGSADVGLYRLHIGEGQSRASLYERF